MPLTIQTLAIPIFCFALALYLNDVYGRRRRSVSDPDATIGRAFALAALILFPLYGVVPWLRPSVAQLLTLCVLLLGVSHLYFPFRRWVRSLLSRTEMSAGRRVLVLGTSAVAVAAARELEKSGCTVFHFGGSSPRQLLYTLSQAPAVIAEMKPARIIVALRLPFEELPLRELLEQRLGGVPMETAHEAYERLTGKIFLDERTPLHLLVSHACSSRRLYVRLRHVFSATVAAVAVVVTLPMMALVALLILAIEKGPVLFVQERVGLNGRPFRLLKFRSMRVEKATSSEWECDNEDRITPLGRWLRRLHLDELPQLWNILRGDMDLVGPRPHPVSNHELFARSIPYYSLRSLVRPGLTGWAQVRQGYAQDLSGEIEKMRYDLCAIARPSLRRDLWVLLATVRIALLGRPLERAAAPAPKRSEHADSLAVLVETRPLRSPLPSLAPEFAKAYRTVSERRLAKARGAAEQPRVPGNGGLEEPF